MAEYINYITALCDPAERQVMQLPPTVCAEFDDHKLELIERQTNAVVKPLRFPEIEIGGTDLAVTLAMSLLEEMSTVRDGTAAMDTDSDVAWSQPACIPPSTPGTRRLSTTLEKALSQHTDGVCRMSDYLQTPATVKRVLLHCLTDINEDINDDINDDEYAFSDDLTIPDADSRGYEEGESQEQMASVVTSTEADFMVRQHDYLHHFGASLGYNKEVVADAIQLIDERTQLIEFISHLSTLKHITGIGDQMPEDDQDVMIIETGTVNLTDDENGVVDLTGEENKSIIDLTDDVGEEDHETSEYIHTVLPDNYKTRLLRDIFQDDSKCSFDERKHQSAERQKVYEMLKLQQPSPQPPPPRAQHTSPKSQHPPRQPEPQKARRQLLHPPPQPQKKMPQPQKSASQLQPAPQLQPQPQEPEQQDRQPTRPTAGDKAAKNSKSTAEKQEAAKSDQPHNFPNRMYKNIKQKPTEAVVPRSASGELSRSQDIPSLVRAANQTEKDELRYIVIDGSNVAMSHGNNRHFSCKGLRICVDYFKQRGHTKITAFVPHWRGARHNNVITDQEILAQLRDEDCLVFTPSRRIRHKLVAAYDDRFILELAEVEDGIIVSNDQYRDLMNEKASWKNIIEERLLMFSFVKDWFMAPSDPLGRSGPSLDTFLRKKQPPRASRPGEPLSNYKQQTYPANQVSQFNHQKGQGYNRDYNHGQRQGEGRLAMYDRRRGYDQTY